jgi:hypothetical protein
MSSSSFMVIRSPQEGHCALNRAELPESVGRGNEGRDREECSCGPDETAAAVTAAFTEASSFFTLSTSLSSSSTSSSSSSTRDEKIDGLNDDETIDSGCGSRNSAILFENDDEEEEEDKEEEDEEMTREDCLGSRREISSSAAASTRLLPPLAMFAERGLGKSIVEKEEEEDVIVVLSLPRSVLVAMTEDVNACGANDNEDEVDEEDDDDDGDVILGMLDTTVLLLVATVPSGAGLIHLRALSTSVQGEGHSVKTCTCTSSSFTDESKIIKQHGHCSILRARRGGGSWPIDEEEETD